MHYPTGDLPAYHKLKDTSEFEAIKLRLYEATGCNSFFDLADFLDTTPALISDARRRGRIPVEWLRTVFLKTPVNPAWIMDGRGERTI